MAPPSFWLTSAGPDEAMFALPCEPEIECTAQPCTASCPTNYVDPMGLDPVMSWVHVFLTPVDLPAYHSGYYHTDLYVEGIDLQGNRTVDFYSYGHTGGNGDSGALSEFAGCGGDAGKLVLRAHYSGNRAARKLANALKNASFAHVQLFGPANANQLFAQAANQINNWQLPYRSLTTNSNAAANFTLGTIGQQLPVVAGYAVPYQEISPDPSGGPRRGAVHEVTPSPTNYLLEPGGMPFVPKW